MVIATSAAISDEVGNNSIKIEENLSKSSNQDVKIEEQKVNPNKYKKLIPGRLELDFKCDISPNKRLECMTLCQKKGYSGSTCRLFKNCKCFKCKRNSGVLGHKNRKVCNFTPEI